MDADVAARTLRLLTLLQARPSWSAAELADRVGTSTRTLRRDLGRLAALGYEVHSRPGPGGHYVLGSGSRMPPLVFDDEEIVALVARLRMVKQGSGAEAAQRALVKLRQVLPRRLAGLVADIAEHSETLLLDEVGPEDVLGPLTAASAADRLVRFSYTDQHDTKSHRRVGSVRCMFIRGRWAALAWDLDREDWRVFLLDRIRDVIGDKPSLRRNPPADDLATWLLTEFGRATTKPG